MAISQQIVTNSNDSRFILECLHDQQGWLETIPNNSFNFFQKCTSKISKTHSYSFVKLITFFILFLSFCQCTQIQIIGPHNHQQMKSLNLMKSLRRYRKRFININNNTYVCITAIKHKPSDSNADSTDKSKQTSQYIKGNIPALAKVQPQIYDNKLDLLADNIGVRHFTKQFIYGYKHKKIVSQFDDDTTKFNNQKKQHQNITMGLHESNYRQQKPKTKVQLSYETYENSHQFTPVDLPARINQIQQSIIPLSLRRVQDAVPDILIDYPNNLINLVRPLRPYKVGTSKTYNISYQCGFAGATPFVNHILAARLNDYQLLSLSQIPYYCSKVLSIYKQQRYVLGFNPEVNTIDNLIIGDIDKFCGITYENGINIGDYIYLQAERTVQSVQLDEQYAKIKEKEQALHKYKKLPGNHVIKQQFLIRIKDIIGQNVYLTNAKLSMTLRPKYCSVIPIAPHRQIDYGGILDTGIYKLTQIETAKNQNQDKIIQFQYRGGKIIKKHVGNHNLKNHHKIQTGLDLFCSILVSFPIQPNQLNSFSFGLTIGKKFGNAFYEIHPWINYQKLKNYQQLGSFFGKMTCVPYNYKTQPQRQENKFKSKYDISLSDQIKMSKNINNKLKVVNTKQQSIQTSNNEIAKISQNSIIILSLSKGAVIQVTTTISQQDMQSVVQSTEQQSPIQQITHKQSLKHQLVQKNSIVNKYLLTQHKMFKIQTILRNGTKIIVQRYQNQLYENSTNQNMILIHKSIWRFQDFLKFPRFLFHNNQRVTSILVKHGSTFVRVFNLDELSRQFFSVSSSDIQNPMFGFGPKVRPQETISTEKRFIMGEFCSGTINKNRETIVKMKCGESWFKLQYAKQISPCTYQIQIVSQYLCDNSIIFPGLKQGFNIFNGTICTEATTYES